MGRGVSEGWGWDIYESRPLKYYRIWSTGKDFAGAIDYTSITYTISTSIDLEVCKKQSIEGLYVTYSMVLIEQYRHEQWKLIAPSAVLT